MQQAPEFVELDPVPLESGGVLVQPRPAIKRRSVTLDESLPGALQPTRSGRNLENRTAIAKEQNPIGRRNARKESEEIASLKARLQQHDTLQSRWKIAQEELTAQKQARAGEAARMAAQVAHLESELEVASSDAVQAFQNVSKQRNLWRLMAALLSTASLSFLCFVLWPGGSAVSRVAATLALPAVNSDTATPGIPPVEAARAHVTRRPDLARKPLPSDPQAAMLTAIDRLNGALETVPGLSPEQALRKAAAAGNGCGIVWTGNLPAVIFGLRPSRPNSLAMTLEDCADVVAQFH